MEGVQVNHSWGRKEAEESGCGERVDFYLFFCTFNFSLITTSYSYKKREERLKKDVSFPASSPRESIPPVAHWD